MTAQTFIGRAALALVWGASLAAATVQAGETGSASLSIAAVRYGIPPVHLVRDDGQVVTLPQEMNDGRPVVLNFIFTSCSSICPLISQVFGQLQQRLGPEAAHVHLMSISIDPEQDTPARLREYARRFHAGPAWQHYTGTLEASLAVQRAFNVWRGDKMSHSAVTFIRQSPDAPWQRVDGFATADDLLRIVRSGLPAPSLAVR